MSRISEESKENLDFMNSIWDTALPSRITSDLDLDEFSSFIHDGPEIRTKSTSYTPSKSTETGSPRVKRCKLTSKEQEASEVNPEVIKLNTTLNYDLTALKDLGDSFFDSQDSGTQFDCSLQEQLDDDILSYDKERLELREFYGLPNRVRYILRVHRSISRLYDWQHTLMCNLVQKPKNTIYCVPTSGGKTLVAELMILREILLNQKNCLLILPYVALVQEKVRSLSPFATDLDFIIEEYAGSKGKIPAKKRRKYKCLYIATIEKAHCLLSSLFEARRLDEIGLVVVDELHMLGEQSRGAVLETLLVKIKLAKALMNNDIRIIGMSATLSNINDISKFLSAQVYEEEFRPVELKQYVKYADRLYEFMGNTPEGPTFEMCKTPLNYPKIPEDPEGLHFLVGQVVPESSCLVFCPTKKHCENVALLLAKTLSREKCFTHMKKEKHELLRDLTAASMGKLCSVLRQSIPMGVAYHHSGLTSDEREFIETAFLNGVISCIVCTSTLAAGINLPAQRVIIRAPYVGSAFLTSSKYKQMSGRAGRAGFCTTPGESILMIASAEKEKFKELFNDPMNECYSALKHNNEKGLSTLILSLFHLELVTTLSEVQDILYKYTLYGVQFSDDPQIRMLVADCFEKLLKIKLIVKSTKDDEKYVITPLGKGTIKGLIDIDKSERLYQQLTEMANSLSLNNYLHLIFIATLLFDTLEDYTIRPDPCKFFDYYLDFDDDEQKSACVIGVEPAMVAKFRRSGVANETVRRFYVTMIVYDVVKNNTEINILAARYDLHRGTLQNLLNQMSTNAHSLLRFVEEIEEFWAYKKLFPDLCQRLTYCCSPELIPLMELPMVKLARAKALYNAGYKCVYDVAKAKIHDLLRDVENIPTSQARLIISGAKKILIDQADELEEQVKDWTHAARQTP